MPLSKKSKKPPAGIAGITLVLAVLIAALIPITLFATTKRWELRRKAAEESGELQQPPTSEQPTEAEYAPGEVLVKFRKGVEIKAPEKDVRSFSVTALKSEPTTKSLATFLEQQKITSLEKVFKGAEDPKQDIRKFKQKFPQRKINEAELEKIDLSRTYKLTFSKEESVEEKIRELSANPQIEHAEPNHIFRAQLVPNDLYYLDSYPDNTENRDPGWNPSHDYQWNLKTINMEQAWDITTGSPGVLVAVVDTGLDYNHAELGNCAVEQVTNDQCEKVAPGYDFVNDDNDPMDDMGHGTHVVGIIEATANNFLGIAGITFEGRVLPIKGLDEEGFGNSDQLADAIIFATDSGASIINMSWGGKGESQVIRDALTYAHNFGVILIAAAGNDNSDVQNFYPAGESDVIAVAATDQNDERASFSNYGAGIDVSAPGVEVISLRAAGTDMYLGAPGYVPGSRIIADEFYRANGTSMAAPHVSALAALILERDPSLTNTHIKNVLINGTDDLGLPSFDLYYGYGRINASQTLTTMDSTDPPVAKISSPGYNLLVGRRFEIFGSAYGEGFSHYDVGYATSPDSTEWSVEGISLESHGRNPVYNDLLATADLSHLPDGLYYLRLMTSTADGKSSYAMTSIQIDSSLRNNFPVQFGSHVYDQQFVVADLNGDGRSEIVFKNSRRAELHVIQADGSPLPGWPQPTRELYADYYRSYSPVVVDLDTSYPGLEVVIPVSETGFKIQLLAFHADGTEVPGWTISDWQDRGELAYTNNTLSSEVIGEGYSLAYAETWKYNQNVDIKMHVFNKDAEDLPGWPITVHETAIALTPVLADIDKDGEVEIIVNYLNDIRIYSSVGGLKKEIKVPDRVSNIAVADLDNDGYLEILATGTLYPSKKVFVWDYQGNIKSDKWPFVLPRQSTSFFNFLSVGDYNSDGYAEVLTSLDHKYYLLDKDANLLEGFPTSGQTPYYAANVTLSSGNHLWATNAVWLGQLYLYEYDPVEGLVTVPPGYPRSFDPDPLSTFVGSPAIFDLDNDGTLELIASVLLPNGKSYLYVFDLDRAASSLDWPQYLHDERHTGAYTASEEPVCVPESLLPGDLDCDCDVDIVDIMKVAAIWNTEEGDDRYNPAFDFDDDGRITVVDIMYIAAKWNTRCSQ